ncbi:hypothetical protein GH714_023317 [Hevea brasiliensis]|uniref:Uncharacterized protein n=1 Tax=Hevea brasiliensis TaxID=3981 RepID=A0A6A6KTT9_HEVBR|nr:hypothetical protein GH714_023317 [Hevea brasiliensis]
MFPLGPRLPLAAIQPSSSAPSNVMFNPPGNSQPSLNQMLRSVSGPSSGLATGIEDPGSRMILVWAKKVSSALAFGVLI